MSISFCALSEIANIRYDFCSQPFKDWYAMIPSVLYLVYDGAGLSQRKWETVSLIAFSSCRSVGTFAGPAELIKYGGEEQRRCMHQKSKKDDPTVFGFA